MVTTANDAFGPGHKQRLPSYEELTARPDFDWVAVLEDAGAQAFLTGNHGPCPFCGGNDRYRFSLKKTAWVCSYCTENKYASCWNFLMRFKGYTQFPQLANHIREFYGYVNGHEPTAPAPVRAPEVRHQSLDKDKCIERMDKVWAATRAVSKGDPVDLYLRGRLPGLGEIPQEIRTHPSLAYWERGERREDKPVYRGSFPAMIVRGFDANGDVVQVHKTYLTTEGQKAPVECPKKTEIGVGSNSFALRLGWPEGETLGVCEGIETGLAANILDGVPVWPCHSSSVLANFVLPAQLRPQIKRLVIYADSDAFKAGKKAGSAAAAQLAERSKKQGLRTLIVRPAKTGWDMANLVQAA